ALTSPDGTILSQDAAAMSSPLKHGRQRAIDGKRIRPFAVWLAKEPARTCWPATSGTDLAPHTRDRDCLRPRGVLATIGLGLSTRVSFIHGCSRIYRLGCLLVL